MNIRNGDTPIQLPDLIRSGDPITAKWANSIRTAIQRLRDRTPVVTGARIGNGVYNHPFKITTEIQDGNLNLFVNYGQVFQSFLRKWNTAFSDPDCQSQQQLITIGGGALNNDPSGATAGFITLSASTTYGIWLKGYYVSLGTFTDYLSSTTLGLGYVTADGYCLFFDSVEAESSYTTPSSKPDNGEVWLFLGSVAVNADSIPTITQWWKSDIVCPTFNMPRIEASTDSGNSLIIGSDGKLFVPPIVSNDINNDISTGSDGGAYYDDPDY